MVELDLNTVNKPKHSHSRDSVYARCPRLYLLQAAYKSLIPNVNLVLGSVIHAALAEWHLSKNKVDALKAADRELENYKFTDQDFINLVNGKAFDILVLYFEKYKFDDINFIVTETPFNLEIKPGYQFKGKIDGIVSKFGANYVGEHKTSSWNNPIFWEQISRSKQLTTYIWAARKLFPDFDIVGYCLNVLFKPTARKEADFKRKFDVIMDWKIKEWEVETCARIDSINDAWNRGSYAFPQSQDRCRDYNTKCEFWDYCENNCNPSVLETTHKRIPLKENI